MSTRALASVASLLLLVLVGGCTSRTDPGPIHRCPVVDWAQYERSCTCDPQGLSVHEGEVIDRGTMVGLFAPPGSLPPGAAVVIEHGGERTERIVAPDGALAAYIRNGDGYDLRGRVAVVRVAGATYTVALDAVHEVSWTPAGVDPRFPPHELAIEDPIGTIAVSARLSARWRATPIEHFAIFRYAPGGDGWIVPTPALGDTVTWTGSGEEGTPIGFVALHESGVASGCYAGAHGLGVCGCSVRRREAGLCRDAAVEAPDAGVDAGSLGDAGPLVDGGAPI